MQQVPSETSQTIQTQNSLDLPNTSLQHGCLLHDPRGSSRDSLRQGERFGSLSPQSVRDDATDSSFVVEGVNGDSLEERLRGLNVSAAPSAVGRSALFGQRISDYENALASSTPRKVMGFKVVKRADTPSDGIQLYDFPNGMSLL